MLFLAGDLTQLQLAVSMQYLNLGDTPLTTGELPASERAKVKTYHGPEYYRMPEY